MEEEGKDAFRGHGKLKVEDEELRRLRRELQIAKEERDILKKAIAFFAKHGK
jgi:transposase